MNTLTPDTVRLDEPDVDEWNRYRIHVVGRNSADRQEIAATSRDGIGLTLTTLYEEGQITSEDRVGVRDALQHKWIISPFAKGRP